MPHPAYISRATLDVEREDLWKPRDDIIDASSSQHDASAPSADAEGRGDYSYGAGSPEVGGGQGVRPLQWIMPLMCTIDCRSDQCGFQGSDLTVSLHSLPSMPHSQQHIEWCCWGPGVATWSRSSFAGGLTSNCVSDLMHKGHQTKVAHFTFM